MGPRREGLKFLHDPRKMTSKPLVFQNIPPSPPKPSLSLAKRHRAPDILIYDKKKLAFNYIHKNRFFKVWSSKYDALKFCILIEIKIINTQIVYHVYYQTNLNCMTLAIHKS